MLQRGIYVRKGGIYARKGGASMKKVYCFNYYKDEVSEEGFRTSESVIFEDDNFIITKTRRLNLISVYHVFNDSTTADFYWELENLPKYIKNKIAKELI